MANFYLYLFHVHGEPIRNNQAIWEPSGGSNLQYHLKKPKDAVNMMEFSDEEKLIEMIKNYPALYDRGRKDFRDSPLKERIWATIGQELNVSGQQCSPRWTSLRERFGRELRTSKANLPSGSGLNHRRSWPLMEVMMWLQPYLRPRKTFGNFPEAFSRSGAPSFSSLSPTSDHPLLSCPTPTQGPSVISQPSCSQSPSSSICLPTLCTSPSPDTIPPCSPSPTLPETDAFHVRKRKRGMDLENALSASLCKFTNYLNKSPKEDEEELFCRSITCALKRLEGKEKNEAKRKILEVLYTYEK